MNDRWADPVAYEAFMGRWSRELGRTFVLWLNVRDGRHWLEIGCGTGALTARVCELSRPASVVAADQSRAFVAHARSALPDPRVQFVAASLHELPPRPGGYEAVVSQLVLNFLPDPVRALKAMKSLTTPGGLTGACVWDYAEGMEMLRHFWDAAVELDPSARAFDEGVRFPVCSRIALEAAFREAGFAGVEVQPLEVEMPFESFQDYWQPFINGPGPAPGYLMSRSTEQQSELARLLERRLPLRQDGSMRLTARAWATRGLREHDS